LKYGGGLGERGFVEDRRVEREVLEQGDGASAGRMQKHASELFADALAADAAELGGMPRDGLGGVGVDLEVESGGESHRPQRAEVVLGESLVGIADGAEDAVAEVGTAVDEVDDAPGDGGVVGGREGIEEEGIDREVAACGVGGGVGKVDGVGPAGV
jgi:hypothetical protein